MALNTKHTYANRLFAHLTAAVSASATSLSFYPEEITNLLRGWIASTWLYLCIMDSSGNLEIVKMTALSNSTLTVERGQGGTTARAWALGSLIASRPVAEYYTRYLQKGVFRSGAYNPNGALTGEYTGEKYYQTGPAAAQRRWWINTTGTKWRLLTGSRYGGETEDADGYFQPWSWDDDFSEATIDRERWHYQSGMEIANGSLCPPLVAAFYESHERAMLEDPFDLYFTIEKNEGEESYIRLRNDLTGAIVFYVYASIGVFAAFQLDSTLGTFYAAAADPFPVDINIYRTGGAISLRWKSDSLGIAWTDQAGSTASTVDLIMNWRPRGYLADRGMGLDDVVWDGAAPGDFYHGFGNIHWTAITGAWNVDHWDHAGGIVYLEVKNSTFGTWYADFRPSYFYIEFTGGATVSLTLYDSNSDVIYQNAAYESGDYAEITWGSYDLAEIEVSDAALTQLDNIMFLV